MFYFISLWRDARTGRNPVLWLVLLPLIANWLPAPQCQVHFYSRNGDQPVPRGLLIDSWCLNVLFPRQELFQASPLGCSLEGWWGWCWVLPVRVPLPSLQSEKVRPCCSPLHPSCTLPPAPCLLQPPSALGKILWYPMCARLCCLSGQIPFLAWGGIAASCPQRCGHHKKFLLLPDPYRLSW